ncbi:MAG: phosphate ABC transporter permease family protein, partial [Pseudomonadota bacterium]
MSPVILCVTLFVLSALGYYMGRKRSFALAHRAGGLHFLNSRPAYYGTLTALWCIVPAVVVMGFWLAFEPNLITDMVVAELPEQVRELPPDQLNVVV